MDIGLALMNEQGGDLRRWVAMQGSVGSAAVVGVPGLTLVVTSFGVEVNLAGADGSVADFKTDPMNVLVAPGESVSLDMDGAGGQLIQVAGSVDICLLDFFQVSGSFAFVSSSTIVRLSDGSSVSVDLITIGAGEVSAFAGLNGGSPEALGFDLSQADFVIALMTDKANPSRKWMALKSEVGSVGFIGIGGLTVQADSLLIEINQNIGTTGAPIPQDPVLTSTELRLETDLVAGTLVFGLDGDTAGVTVSAHDTGTTLRANITAALESLAGVGIGNVSVSGNRSDGFSLVFGNALKGTDLSGLTVSVESPVVATAVVERVTGRPPQVDVELTPVTVNTALLLETDIEVGSLEFFLRGETRTVEVTAGTTDAALISLIEAALSEFTGVGVDNVSVSGSRAAGFAIEFVNALAGQDFSDLVLSVQTPGVEASVSILVRGEKVVTSTTTEGNYTREQQILSFTDGFRSTNTRYELEFDGLTTGKIDFSVNSPTYNRALLQSALESLTSIKKGNVLVAFDQTSTSAAPRYIVTFTGKLAYQDVPEITVVYSNNVTVTVSTSRNGSTITTTETVEDVPAEQQVRVQSDAQGTFTLSLVHEGTTYTTAPLTFEAAAEDVRTALNTSLSAIAGADATVTSTMAGVWKVVFGGSLAGQDIARMTVSTTTVPLDASLRIVERGLTRTDSETVTTPAVNEIQRVRVTAQTGGTFTLEIDHEDTTRITAGIDFDADASEIREALADAFADVAEAQFMVTGVSAGVWDIEFGGSLGGTDLAMLKVVATPDVAAASLSVEVRGESVARPDVVPDADPNLVVDFGVENLSVKTGPSSEMIFDMDGFEGALIRAVGNLKIDLFGFFMLEGGFGFEKSTATVLLADGSEVAADMLAVGGGGIDAFAGINGGTGDAIGLSVREVDFALGLFSSQAEPTRKWTALQATANGVALVGIEGFTAEATDIVVNVNNAGDGGAVIDFAARNLEILTGPGTSIVMDLDGARGELLEAAGTLNISVVDFVELSGYFAFSKSGSDLVALGQNVTASLTIGDQVHVSLAGADFGFINGAAGAPVFELKNGAFSAAIDGFADIEADTVLVRYTGANAVEEGTTLSIGSGSYTFEEAIAADTVAFQVNGFSASLFSFLWISGDLFIHKSVLDSITLTDGTTVGTAGDGVGDVETLQIGAHIDSAFAGINGPWDSLGALGLLLGDVDLAVLVLAPLALPAPATTQDKRSWTAVRAVIGTASFTGIDGLAVAVGDFSVEINQGGGTLDGADNDTVVDFSSDPVNIDVSASRSISIDYGEKSLMAQGRVTLDVFGFVQFDGSMSFRKGSGSFVVTDADTHQSTTLSNAPYLQVGGHVESAFAGVGGIGFELSGVDFGLLLVSDDKGTLGTTDDVKYTVLKADADSAGLAGIEGLTAQVNSLSVQVNKTSDQEHGNKVLDFVDSVESVNGTDGAAGSREISTGLTTPAVVVDMDGDEGVLLSVMTGITIDVFGFVQVDGSLAFKKATGSFVLTDATSHESDATTLANVDYMEVGGHVDSAFAGVGGIGFELTGVNFGIVMVSDTKGTLLDKTDDVNYLALKADAGSAGFVGIEGLTALVNSLSVQVNKTSDEANGNKVLDFVDSVESVNGTDGTAGSREIATGLTTPAVVVDMDGDEGVLLSVMGGMELGVFGFFHAEGNIAFKKSSATITVMSESGSETVEVDVLTAGASHISAFAGVNGPGSNPDALGFSLSEVNFALAVMKPRESTQPDPTDQRTWTSLKASVGGAEFVGIDDITVQVTNLFVEINRGSGTKDDVPTTSVAHFEDENLRVVTGIDSFVDLDFDGDRGSLLRAGGVLTLGIGEFGISGGFGIEKSESTRVEGAKTIRTSKLLVGTGGVDIFLGAGDAPYGNDDMGVLVEDVQFGMVLFKEVDITDPGAPVALGTTKTALTASGGARLLGIDGLELSGTLSLMKNDTGFTTDLGDGYVVYETLDIPDPNDPENPITIEVKFRGDVSLGLSGTLTFRILNTTSGEEFVSLTGGFAFEKSEVIKNSVTTTKLKVGAAGVETFLGVGPAKIADTSTQDPDDKIINPDAMGILIDDAELGLVLFKRVDSNNPTASTSSYAIDASGSATLLGIDALSLSGSLGVRVNTTGRTVDETVTVPLPEGGSKPVHIVFTNTSSQPVISGTACLELAGVVRLTGGFSFSRKVTGSETRIVAAAAGIEAFVGANAGTDDAIGVKATINSLGVVLVKEGTGTTSYALQGEGGVALVGLDGLDVTGNASLRINQTGRAIDETILVPNPSYDPDIPAGAGNPLTIDASVVYTSASMVQAFEGSLVFEVVDVFRMTGTVSFRKMPTGTVIVDVPTASVSVTIDGEDIFSINGHATFTIGGAEGFQLKDLKVDGFSIMGIDAGVQPPAAGQSSPTADLVWPEPGSMVQQSDFIGSPFIDVIFNDPNGVGLNTASIIDSEQEFELTDASGGTILVNGTPQSMGGGTYRYQILSPVNITQGEWTIHFLGGSWKDNNLIGGLSETETFIVRVGTGPTADLAGPKSGATVDLTLLNAQKYIDVIFTDYSGLGIDPDSITDVQPEFSIVTGGDASISGAVIGNATHLYGNTYRYRLIDLNPNDAQGLFTEGIARIVFIANSWSDNSGASNAAETESFTVSASTSSAATATKGLSIGPISLQSPKVGITGLGFKDMKLIVTVGIGVGSASLNFGGGGSTTQSSTQQESGITTTMTGVLGTFDLAVDVLGFLQGSGSISLTGAWSLSVSSFDLEIPNLLEASATGIKIGYDPAYEAQEGDVTGQELVRIDSASLIFPTFHIAGRIDTFTTDGGETIPGLVIWENGFQFGTVEIVFGYDDPQSQSGAPVNSGTSTTGEQKISLLGILEFEDIRFGINNFKVVFGESFDFDGEIYVASGGAAFFPGKPISAVIKDRTTGTSYLGTSEAVDTEALRATVSFTDNVVDSFKFQADTFEFVLGSFLKVQGVDAQIDTGAGDDEDVVSFTSLGVTLRVATLNLSGEMRNFSFTGNGSFKTKAGFGVFFGAESVSGDSVGWPSWLPIQIQQIGIEWADINSHPEQFVLTLSASVTGIPGVKGIKFSGAIEGIKIDLQKLFNGEFPIVDLGALAVGLAGNLFGGDVSGTLLGGIIKIGADGSGYDNMPVPAEAPADTPVKDRILFIGVQGTITIAGYGFGIRFALSELGPLGVQIEAKVPIGPIPYVMLFFKDFVGGVEFFTSLPDVTEPKDLRSSEFEISTSGIDAGDWLQQVKSQVVTQYLSIQQLGNSLGFFAAFTSPMTITGSAVVYTQYTSEQVFNGLVGVKISTDGKFFITGKLRFLMNNITVSAKIYADVSKLLSGQGQVLFLADVPEELELITIGGALQLAFEGPDDETLNFDIENTLENPLAIPMSPFNDQYVDFTEINDRGYIEIQYMPSTDSTLVEASVVDFLPEFTLAGEAAADVVIDDSLVSLENGTYRYPFTGQFKPGDVTMEFAAASFSDNAGKFSEAGTVVFHVTGAYAELAGPNDGGSIDIEALEANKYLYVRYLPTVGSTVNEDTVNDNDLAFTLTFADGSSLDVCGPPVEVDGAFRYDLPVDLELVPGQVTVDFAAGAWSDAAGTDNIASSQIFTILGATAAMIDPVADGGIDIILIENRRYLDVQFFPAGDNSLDESSIFDDDAEFTLSIGGGAPVEIRGPPTLEDGSIYRYALPDTLDLEPGQVELVFIAGSFEDDAGIENAESRHTFIIRGASADLADNLNHGVTGTGKAGGGNYIDIIFTPTSGNAIVPDSITDPTPEFTLLGSACADLNVLNDQVEQIDETTFRYYLDGDFVVGEVEVAFIADSWEDSAGYTNLEETEEFSVRIPTADIYDPQPEQTMDRNFLANRGYILVKFNDNTGKGIDISSITDEEPEFRFEGEGAGSVVVNGKGTLVDEEENIFSFTYSGSFEEGFVNVNFIKDSWQDTEGTTNEVATQKFRVVNQAASIILRVSGFMELHAAGLTPDFNGDGLPDPLMSYRGSIELSADFALGISRLILEVNATLEIIYFGNLGSVAGRFILQLGQASYDATGDSQTSFGGLLQFWGVVKIQYDLEALKNIGISFDAEMMLMVNTTGVNKIETIALEGIRGDVMFTVSDDGITSELPVLGAELNPFGGEYTTSIPDALRTAFADNGINLSDSLTVQCVVADQSWKVWDNGKGNKLYFVDESGGELTIRSENQTFDIAPYSFDIFGAGAAMFKIPPVDEGSTELFRISGVFNLRIDSDGISMFLQGEFTVGPPENSLVSFTAMGMLKLNLEGFAGMLLMNYTEGVGGLFDFEVDFQAYINLTIQHEETKVVIPSLALDPDKGYLSQKFIDSLDTDENGSKYVSLPEGPPQLDGTIGQKGPYVVIQGAGQLTYFQVYKFQGAFRFELSVGTVQLQISAGLPMGALGQFQASGFIELNLDGVVGALSLRVTSETGILRFIGLELIGEFRLELNNSAVDQEVILLLGPGETRTITIPANTFQIVLAGGIAFSPDGHEIFRIAGEFPIVLYESDNEEREGPAAIFVHEQIHIGPEAEPYFSVQATGLFMIIQPEVTDEEGEGDGAPPEEDPANEGGMVAYLNLSGGIEIGDFASFSGDFTLTMNDTLQEQVYVVDEEYAEYFEDQGGIITIPNGPEQFDGSMGDPIRYLVINGNASLVLGDDMLSMSGRFRFNLLSQPTEIEVATAVDFGVLGTLNTYGKLSLGAGGIMGVLFIEAEDGFGGDMFTFKGDFFLSVSTYEEDMTILRPFIDPDTAEVTGYEEKMLPGGSVIIEGGALLSIVNMFEISGAFYLTSIPTGFELQIDGYMELGGLARARMAGQAGIFTDPGIAMSIQLGIDGIDTDFMQISADFSVKVNTSPTDEHFGVPAMTFLIEAEGILRIANVVHLHGTMTIQLRTYLADVNLGMPANYTSIFEELQPMYNALYLPLGIQFSEDMTQLADLPMRAMIISGSLDGFIGFGTPDFSEGAPDLKDQDIAGFVVKGFDFGLIISEAPHLQLLCSIASILNPLYSFFPPQLYNLKATIAEIGTVGFGDWMTIYGEGLTLELGYGFGLSPYWGIIVPTVDMISSFPGDAETPAGMDVPLGDGTKLYVDTSDRRFSLSMDHGRIALMNFVHLEGGFTFELGVRPTLSVGTGIPANLGSALGALGFDEVADFFASVAGMSVGENFSTIGGWEMDSMTIGASNVNAFIGFGNPDFDQPLSDQDLLGFGLQDLDIGIGIFRPTLPPIPLQSPIFVSMKATSQEFGAYGFGDWCDIGGRDVELNVNVSTGWEGTTLSPALDFLADFPGEAPGEDNDGDGLTGEPAGFEVPAGGESVYLDFDGNTRIGLSIGEGRIHLFDFIHLQGGFAFELGPTYRVDVATGIPGNLGQALGSIGLDTMADALASVADMEIGENFSTLGGFEVESFTIGASNVSGFVGFGDPDFDRPLSEQDLMGFGLRDLDLGFALFKSTIPLVPPLPPLPVFVALKATAQEVGTYGFGDWLDIGGRDITISLNAGSPWMAPGPYGASVVVPGIGPPVINFAQSFPAEGEGEDNDGDGLVGEPAGFQVPAGNDSVYLDYDGNLRIGLSIGDCRVKIYNFLHLQGSFAFELGPTYLVNVATGIPSILGSALGDIGLDTVADTLTSVGGISVGENFSSIDGLEVASMTVGATNVNGFFGFGDPDFSRDLAEQDLYGFAIQDLNLGMGIFTPTLKIPGLPSFLAMKMDVGFIGTLGFGDWMTVSASDVSINVNTGSKWLGLFGPPVIDFAAGFPAEDPGTDPDNDGLFGEPAGFEVPTGADPIYLDFDGSERISLELIDARVSVLDFVHLRGNFAFEMGPVTTVTVNTGLSADLIDDPTLYGVEVATMTVGASDVNAFVGVNGPYFGGTDPGTAFGLYLEDFDFGMAILTPTLFDLVPGMDQFAPKFIGLKAHAESAGLVGGGDVLDFSITDITVSMNGLTSSVLKSSIDFVDSFPAEPAGEDLDNDDRVGEPAGFEVNTGGEPVYLDFEGQLYHIDAENVTATISEFVYLSGSFAFEKGPRDSVTVNTGYLGDLGLPDTMDMEMEIMTIGASNVQAFVGMGGPYLEDTDGDGDFDDETPNDGAIGLTIDDLDFGMVVMAPTMLTQIPGMDAVAPKFYAMSASADLVGLVGTGDVISASGHNVEVQLNSSTLTLPGVGSVLTTAPHVDFAASYETSPGARDGTYEIDTGLDPVTVDYGSELIKAKIEFAEFGIAGAVYLAGGAAFVKGPTQTVTLTDGSTKTVTTMTLGVSNVYGFMGLNGPYLTDTNGDLTIDGSDSPNTGAIGFALQDLDVGIAFMKGADTFDASFFLAGKCSVRTVEFVGIEGIEATAQDLEVAFNLGASVESGVAVVDFTEMQKAYMEVPTGNVNAPVILDFDGFLIRASGRLNLSVTSGGESWFSLDGVFEFEVTGEHLQLYADSTLLIGPEESPILSFAGTGLLVIDAHGIAMKLDVRPAVDLEETLGIAMEAEFKVLLNTMEQDIIYDLPDSFPDVDGQRQVVIPGVPPGSDDGPEPYLRIEAAGSLVIMGVLELDGQFYFQVSTTNLEIFVSASGELEPLGSVGVTGNLRIEEDGVVGGMRIDAPLGLGTDMFRFNGYFLLAVNTTGSAGTVYRLDIDTQTGEVSDELIESTIEPNTLLVEGGGELDINGMFVVEGAFYLLLNEQGFEVQFDAYMELGGFGRAGVKGAGGIYREPALAVNLELEVDSLVIPMVSIEGQFQFQINTSSTREHMGVAPGSFLVRVQGKVSIMLFTGEGDLSLVLQGWCVRGRHKRAVHQFLQLRRDRDRRLLPLERPVPGARADGLRNPHGTFHALRRVRSHPGEHPFLRSHLGRGGFQDQDRVLQDPLHPGFHRSQSGSDPHKGHGSPDHQGDGHQDEGIPHIDMGARAHTRNSGGRHPLPQRG